ncbi:hypothetical protein GCM10010253_08960 [Streptomyces badius]|uniref:LacI family transcriptional regulator n=1 Tax=Streptomyces badius TaxID=1941 RepID=A0ABQ2SR38_STRBA|nr:hypothetical protein GCM10010253_08960 [Streptomyces badius]
MAAEMTRLLLDRSERPDGPVISVIFEPEPVVRSSAWTTDARDRGTTDVSTGRVVGADLNDVASGTCWARGSPACGRIRSWPLPCPLPRPASGSPPM